MINRKKLKLSETIITIGAVIYFIGFLADLMPLQIAAILVIAAGFVVNFLTCRCPWCGKPIRHLSSARIDLGYCQYCGYKLDFDE